MDDEPFIVPGANAARIWQADIRLASRTRNEYPLILPDGSIATQVVHSVRPPMGRGRQALTYNGGALEVSVRRFLGHQAVRTTDDYNTTEDSITGVDWDSSHTSTPSNAKGVQVPTLIMQMTCHYFLVVGEIIYEHAASVDKELVFVEGASHGFSACRPQYGDTVQKLFDYVANWLDARF